MSAAHAGLDIVPFAQVHGGDRDPTLGLRFGRFAYSTDVKELPEAAFAALAGVEVWIVDCLREPDSRMHVQQHPAGGVGAQAVLARDVDVAPGEGERVHEHRRRGPLLDPRVRLH